MEENNPIIKSWRREETNFKDNLFVSRKRPTKDAIHDLRVAVKRMRSYLRLNEQISGEKWKQTFLKISILFKSFGRLRDFDISLTLTRKQEKKEQSSFIPFKEYLCVNRSLARKWVKQDATSFNETEPKVFEQWLTLFSGLPEAETYEKIISAAGLKLKKAKSLTKQFQKNAHDIRKQLKDVYYWLKICPKDQVENFLDLKALDRMLTYLGDWQDHFILQKKIKNYCKELPKKNEEKVALREFEKKLADSQEEILEKAIKKWQEITFKKVT
jgi:CHAD domain-containing protein